MEATQNQNKGWRFFLLGMGILLAAHGLVAGLLTLLSMKYEGIGLIFIFAIGLTQLIYGIPILIVLFIKKQKSMAYGVLTMMGITFLLNSACFGFLILMGNSLSHLH